jgi:hypothetical protein
MHASRSVGIITVILIGYVALMPGLTNGSVFAFNDPGSTQTPLMAILGLSYVFALWGALVAVNIFAITWAAHGWNEIDRTHQPDAEDPPVELSSKPRAQLGQRAS